VEVARERAAHDAALNAIDDLKRELMSLADARDAAVGRRDEALSRCRRVAEKLQSVLESSPSL
jgi:hypothetical protein